MRAVAKRVALFVAAAAAGLSFTWLSMISDAAEAMAWPGILIDHVLNPVEPGTIRKDPDLMVIIPANTIFWALALLAILNVIARVVRSRRQKAHAEHA